MVPWLLKHVRTWVVVHVCLLRSITGTNPLKSEPSLPLENILCFPSVPHTRQPRETGKVSFFMSRYNPLTYGQIGIVNFSNQNAVCTVTKVAEVKQQVKFGLLHFHADNIWEWQSSVWNHWILSNLLVEPETELPGMVAYSNQCRQSGLCKTVRWTLRDYSPRAHIDPPTCSGIHFVMCNMFLWASFFNIL